MNSEPLIDINGTPASPAIALAINVFPVPGFPYKRIPFGILAPISKNFFGSFKKSTISINSVFSSSKPATSENVVLVFSLFVESYTFPLSPNPCILKIIMNSISIIIVGIKEIRVSDIFKSTLSGF